jgi:hypothetical protein
MKSTFLDTSIDVANRFIRTITFVDDEVIFSIEDEIISPDDTSGNQEISHKINANSIIKEFAKYIKVKMKKIICYLY